LQITFSILKDLKQAVCAYNGISNLKKAKTILIGCPKYSECNFLHLFQNPNGAYGIESSDAKYTQDNMTRFEKMDQRPDKTRRYIRGKK